MDKQPTPKQVRDSDYAWLGHVLAERLADMPQSARPFWHQQAEAVLKRLHERNQDADKSEDNEHG